MDTLYFSWVDYTLFVLTLCASVAIGIYYGFFAKQDKTAKSYLLGNKNMNFFPIAMSLVASCASSVTLLSNPTEVYFFGTQYMLIVVSDVIVGIVLYYTFLPAFWKLKISSAYEYLEIRFCKTVRSIANFLFSFISFIHVSLIIYSPSLAMSQVTGFGVYWVAIGISVICIFYTAVGGLKAVVWADVLQLIVMLLTLFVVFTVGTVSTGGVGIMWDRAMTGGRLELFNMNIDPTIRSTFWSCLIGSTFTTLSFLGASQHTVQRFLAVKDLKNSRRVVVTFVILLIILQFLSLSSGAIIYAKYYDCDPLSAGYIKRADQILPYFIFKISKDVPGIGGLFIAGMLSACLSTLSTLLNSLSGLVFDMMAPLLPEKIKKEHANLSLKVITALLGFLGFALVFVIDKLGTLLELTTSLHAFYLGPLLGVFILGLSVPFAERKGVFVGVAVSLVVMIFYLVRRQIYVWNGSLKRSGIKSLRTDGCNASSSSVLMTTTVASVSAEPQEEIAWFYKLSFHYFVTIGTLLFVIVGFLVSWWASKGEYLVNVDALSPCIRKFYKNTKRDSMRHSKETIPIQFKDLNNGDNEEQCTRYKFV